VALWIVIGDEFWKYLNAAIAEFAKGSTPVAKSITAIVKRIMPDGDGQGRQASPRLSWPDNG
jgi:hypothetical protein